MTLNGSLAGLVAITAGCDAVTPVGAFFIGLVAAFVVVFGIEFVDKILKIDDPVGAIGVHGFCGATGTLLTGLFAYYLTDDAGNPLGLFYGGGFKFLGTQALGVISVTPSDCAPARKRKSAAWISRNTALQALTRTLHLYSLKF